MEETLKPISQAEAHIMVKLGVITQQVSEGNGACFCLLAQRIGGWRGSLSAQLALLHCLSPIVFLTAITDCISD